MTETSRSSGHAGRRPPSAACPKGAAGDHVGWIGEGERALFQLKVAAGDQRNI